MAYIYKIKQMIEELKKRKELDPYETVVLSGYNPKYFYNIVKLPEVYYKPRLKYENKKLKWV